jgi:hypothetical protein
MAGRYRGLGIGLPAARAASNPAALAVSNSANASAGVAPNAEQGRRSGMSAM